MEKKMKKIIINKNLKFTKDDLTQYVDASKLFTLKDVFNCIRNSKVPISYLKKILKCGYLEEYIEEANKKNNKPSKEYSKINYLQVYLTKEIDNDKTYWSFDGVGEEDKIGCNKYALDFTPLYEIADLKIRVSNIIENYDMVNKKIIKTKFTPLLMLVELLHAVAWEVSWNGSIENRELRLNELMKRVKSIKKVNSKK